MDRRPLALALFVVAAVCFAIALAGVIGSDVEVNVAAWGWAGFLATALALVWERLR